MAGERNECTDSPHHLVSVDGVKTIAGRTTIAVRDSAVGAYHQTVDEFLERMSWFAIEAIK